MTHAGENERCVDAILCINIANFRQENCDLYTLVNSIGHHAEKFLPDFSCPNHL